LTGGTREVAVASVRAAAAEAEAAEAIL